LRVLIMNALLTRSSTRAVVRSGVQKRFASHADDMPAEEAMRDIHIWKKASYAGVAFLALFFAKLMTTPHHEEPERKPYSHLAKRKKLFPWGDGNHGLFENAFGRPGAHHHEEGHH